MYATSIAAPPATPRRPFAAALLLVVISAAAGVGLGVLDLAAQRTVPYPWADLANSSAVWAVAAFVIGCWAHRVRCAVWQAAVAGVVLLVVAVEAYYLAGVVWLHDSAASLTSESTQAWLAFAVLAGVAFGAAGAWTRGPHLVRASIGAALAGSVLYAEALVLLGDAQRGQRVQVAVLEAALGVAIVLVAATTNRRRALALVACVPLTALGYYAFTAAGFAG